MAAGLEGVDRALRVLTLLGQRGDGWTLDELASETTLPKSSLHRLLTALKARGFAVQPAPNGPYLLGPAALEVAFGFHEKLDVPILMAPLLQDLVEPLQRDHPPRRARPAATSSTSTSARAPTRSGCRRPSGAAIRPTAPESARRCSRTRWSIGRPWTSTSTSYGPLVAQTPDDGRQSRKALNAELELTRSRGFALDLEENEPGVHCAAIAVTLGTGRPVAAVSVTAPTMRITRDQLDEIGLDLLASRRSISCPPAAPRPTARRAA